MPTRTSRSSYQWVVLFLGVLALIVIVIGVVYLVVPAKSLAVIPGHISANMPNANAHRTRRGTGLVVIGAAIAVVAAGIWYALRRR